MPIVSDLKIPGKTTTAGRASSITNAFINAPLPYLEPTREEKRQILQFLEIDTENVRCAYCGDGATEWDHFYPTVKNRKETGYFTEKSNLVPACGKCNQSKGNKDWEIWIKSSAPLSPYKRGVPNLENRVRLLREFAEKFPPRKIDLSAVRKTEQWVEYESLREEIVKKLRQGDEMAKKIRKLILDNSGLHEPQSEAPLIPLMGDEE